MGDGRFDAVLALLLVRRRPRSDRRRARLVRLLLGHPDVQEIGRRSAASRPRFRTTGCWSRRMRPISRRSPTGADQRAGLRGPYGAGAGEVIGVIRRRDSPRSRPRISTACSPRPRTPTPGRGCSRHEPARDDPRLRLLRRRAARRLGLGRLRSGEPEEPPPALLDPGRADRSRRATPAFSSTPRRTCASSSSTPTCAARRGAVHARACRPHPRDRRPAAARHPDAPAHPDLRRRDDQRRAVDALRLLLRDAARQRIPADPLGRTACGRDAR